MGTLNSISCKDRENTVLSQASGKIQFYLKCQGKYSSISSVRENTVLCLVTGKIQSYSISNEGEYSLACRDGGEQSFLVWGRGRGVSIPGLLIRLQIRAQELV